LTFLFSSLSSSGEWISILPAPAIISSLSSGKKVFANFSLEGLASGLKKLLFLNGFYFRSASFCDSSALKGVL